MVTPCTLEGEAERVPEELRVVVRVGVDDTGRHHEPGGVELGGRRLVDLADGDDAAVPDPDVGQAAGLPGAVDERAGSDDVVEHGTSGGGARAGGCRAPKSDDPSAYRRVSGRPRGTSSARTCPAMPVDNRSLLRNPRVASPCPQVIHRLCPTPSPCSTFRAALAHVLCSDRADATIDAVQPRAEPPTDRRGPPRQLLERAIRAGYIDAGRFKIPEANVQPASLDLRLGERALRIRCSFLPGTDSVERKLKDYILDEIDLRGDGAMLEARCPYLIELKERLDLPAGLRGKANPKSSTGRIDVFTRVITDHSDRFDEMAPGYHGPLYLEVVPLSFAVRVKEDLTLNQLRLSMGRPWLSDDEVRADAPRGADPLPRRASRCRSTTSCSRTGSSSVSTCSGDERGQVGHSTRDSAPLLDLTTGGEVDPRPFWDPVFREDGDRLVLSPKRFYLLMSDEAVSIPPNLAAEMTAYDPTSGELRTHYAGFFDPGFGFDPTGGFRGSRAALEVRAHDVPFMVENGQAVCKLTFERMLEEPTALYGSGIGSSYQQQEETLSRYFRRTGT